MKVLKNGFKLMDFSVSVMVGNEIRNMVVKDKGSKSQAIHQIEQSIGNGTKVLSIKKI